MKNILICSLIIFYCNTSYAQKVKSTNKKATKIYKQHLLFIDKYLDLFDKAPIGATVDLKDIDTDKFNEAISFLEKLTNIYCDTFYSYIGEGEPSRENYKDWKSWYKLNKKSLYIENEKIKINNPKPLIKNPVKYFKSKLKLVKKSIKRKEFEEPEYSNAIYFLRKLTNVERKNYEDNLDVPSEKDLNLLKFWLKQNKNKLYWNVKEHTVKLKN